MKFSDTWLSDRRWEDFKALTVEGKTYSDTAEYMADKIKAGGFLSPTAISQSLAAEMIERGLISPSELEAAGF